MKTGNEIIAEFMGAKFVNDAPADGRVRLWYGAGDDEIYCGRRHL